MILIIFSSYFIWWLIARRYINKKQIYTVRFTMLLLLILCIVPMTVTVERYDMGSYFSNSVMFVNEPYAFGVFILSWSLIYFFRTRNK